LLSTAARAQGDDCSTATPITDSGTFGVVATQAFNTCGFSIAGPVLSCNGITDIRDGWFLYTANLTGAATFSVCAASTLAPGGSVVECNTLGTFDSVLAAYDSSLGANCPITNPELACNDDGGGPCGLSSEMTFGVTAGQAYWIAIGDWVGGTGGMSGTLAFVVNPPIANDECLTAIPLANGVNAGLNNLGSTGSAEFSTCAGNTEPDVWFTYTPLTTGTLEASTCPTDGGNSDAALGFHYITIWDGVCGALTQNQCQIQDWRNNFGCGTASRAQGNVTAGVPVFISVAGFLGSQGTFDLALNEFPTAPGNGCNNAIPINNGQHFVDTTSDGLAPTGPAPTCMAGGNLGLNGTFLGVWYAWTAPCQGGTAILNTCPTTGFFGGDDTTIAIWDNCPTVPGAVEVACDDDSGGTLCGQAGFSLKSYIQWAVIPGNTYYFNIGGWQGDQGPITFDINCIYVHLWQEQNGPGTYSIQLENIDGPPNALVISAITLDILHPGLPVNLDFPNGWFFGVPLSFNELVTQITWPGGLPFVHTLDAVGYRLNIQAPNGTTFGFGVGFLNASIQSVGVAFDPAFGFTTIQQTTDPTLYVVP
jgi:hypothetical protein